LGGTLRVGILSQWYDPEPGSAAVQGVLARTLAARGHSVQVVTGFANYPTGKVMAGYRLARRLDEENEGGIEVRRVAPTPATTAPVQLLPSSRAPSCRLTYKGQRRSRASFSGTGRRRWSPEPCPFAARPNVPQAGDLPLE